MSEYITASDFPQHLQDRFWEQVALHDPDQCWMWTSGKDGRYGRFYYKDSHIRAHRLAYILKHGSIPDGLEVCHSCDVPLCVNPRHLFIGSHQDNMSDMVAKGRTNAPKGTRQHLARLDEEKVLEIRRLYASGKYSHLKLAHIFEVSEPTIRQVVTRTTWTHI